MKIINVKAAVEGIVKKIVYFYTMVRAAEIERKRMNQFVISGNL